MRALLALALLAAAPAAIARCELDYRIALRADATPRRFEVTLRVPARGRVHTTLHVTPEWGGVTDFHRAIGPVSVDGGDVDNPRPGTWKLSHRTAGTLTVRYAVSNDVPNLDGPMDHRDFYRAMVGASFFHVFGHALFLVPEEMVAGAPMQACVRFEGLPHGARFASSLGGEARAGVASMRARIAPDALAESVFVGGDWRILRRTIAGRPLTMAVRGEWTFSDAQFAEATAALVAVQRGFWRDFAFPRFLVTLLPNRLEHGSYGGTAVAGAFAMHAAKDFAVPGRRFEHLLAHEHVHTWLPRRIGAMPADDEAVHYWFSEGFTNYLSHRLLVTAGSWDLRDYARAMNDLIARYGASRYARLPNAEAAPLFWKDGSAHDLPYLRGELMALTWARRLERSGTTLEATLRALRLPRAADDGPLAVDRLRAAVEHTAGTEAAAELDAHVGRGEPFRIDRLFLGPCFEGATEPRRRFELGFDDNESRRLGRITGVVAGSAAQAAGLQDGMAMEGWSVTYGDVSRDAVVRVREAGGSRTIRYRPVTSQPVDTMVFHPIAAGGSDAACRRWMED